MENKISITDCKLISLPKIGDRTGQITAVNNNVEIPFEINRVFYLYDIPAGEDRGAHAHKECHQFLVAASGAFEVEVDDGTNKKTFSLNQPNLGLHVPPGIWAAELNFSSGSICLVLASHPYQENDYIRDYQTFLNYTNND
jgi:WxcM-like, C-terminal